MDVYNLSFDEFKKKILKAQRNHFPNDQTSPTVIRERVVVVDTRKNPNAFLKPTWPLQEQRDKKFSI